MLEAQPGEPMLQQHLMARATKLAEKWARMSPLRMRVILVALVQRVEIRPDEMIIHLRPHRLAALLEDRLTTATPDPVDDEPTVPLSHPVQLRRAGKEVRMVIDHTDPFAPLPKPDPGLIKAIVNAHRFNENLMHGGAGTSGPRGSPYARPRRTPGTIRLIFAVPEHLPQINPPLNLIAFVQAVVDLDQVANKIQPSPASGFESGIRAG